MVQDSCAFRISRLAVERGDQATFEELHALTSLKLEKQRPKTLPVILALAQRAQSTSMTKHGLCSKRIYTLWRGICIFATWDPLALRKPYLPSCHRTTTDLPSSSALRAIRLCHDTFPVDLALGPLALTERRPF